MSSGEKLAKGKSKKAVPKTKNTKGKEVPINDQRFRGEGVKFKCKLVGTTDVNSARGDAMCAEAIKKLKVQALKLNKESGEHKLRIVMYVTIKGIRIVDEKTQKVVHEHPINKISFITHDPEDKKIFGYVCSQPCTTGHKLFAIKSEKAAGVVTGTLYELFQVVFQLRQQAGLTKKAPNSAPVSNGPSPQESDGIYEVPYKNGNNKQAKASPQVDHEYAEPIKTETKKDPHYKVPKNQLVQAALPPIPVETNKDVEVGEKTASADVLNSSTLLSQSSMDKDPDQVSQASMEVPFTTHDNSGAEMAFFGSSVFDSTPAESAAADTVSVASADVAVLRSGSVSSGSSESHSQDTRSVHSRSGSLLNQTGSATPNQTEGFQAEFATAFEDKLDVEPSLGSEVKQEEQEAIPAAIPTTDKANTEDAFKAPPVMKTLAVFESPPDPFASSDTSTNERTQPVAGENFFSESFAAFGTAFNNNEVKSNEDNSKNDDPFASSSGAQEKNNAFESAEGFASETSFEAAFGSEQFTPSADDATVDNNQTQEEAGDEKTVNEKSEENSTANFSWENAFGETKTVTQPETTQSCATSEVKFSWTESFASDDIEPSVKTGPGTSASVTWDDAFGGAADTGSSNQAPDAFSWDDAFGGMAADSNKQQPESTAFGNAFAPSSAVSSSDVLSVPEQSTQPALQPTLPSDPELSAKPKALEDDVPSEPQPFATENPQLFSDDQFTNPTPSQAQDSATSVADIEESSNPPSLLKDPFEGLGINFHASTPGKINEKETHKSPESETGSGNEEDLFAKKNVPSELPSEENLKETNNVKEVEEIFTQPEEQIPEEDKMDEKGTSEIPEARPSELQIQESTPSLSERPVSPTAPPPLPPRPAASAPPLPARPSSSSSTTSTGRSPISPRTSIGSPASNSPHHGKKGSAKKPPPALPPRVDLHEKSVNSSSDEKEAFPDPFGSDFFDHIFDDNKVVSEGGNSDWAASWPSAQKTSEEKSKDQNSDPFSEDFFTNFDFPQKGASSISTKSDNVDPFAATNPSSGKFPSAFGNEDLFAAFTPAKGETVFGSGDPFSNDLSDSFAAFSSEDPFSDISDPFADKGVLSDDPFGDSPRKPPSGKAITLNESLVASDEADSFA